MRSLGPPDLKDLVGFDVRDREYRVLMTQLRCDADSSVYGLYPNELMDRSWLFSLDQFEHIKRESRSEIVIVFNVCTITDTMVSHVRDVLSETSPRTIRSCMRRHSFVDSIYEVPVEKASNQTMSMTARLSITRIGNWNKPLEAVEAEIRYRLADYFDIVDCERIKLSLSI